MPQSRDDRRKAGAGEASPGVTISAGRDVDASGATIVGRDQNITNKRSIRIGLGGGLVLLLGAGTATVYGISSSHSAADIAHKAGEAGAQGTLLAMRDAEINGKASRWCYLASEKNSSTCQSLMANSFSSAQSVADRAEVRNITVRRTGGSGDRYNFTMVIEGNSYPVPMQWTGKRWELSPGLVYTLAVNNGGIFVSVIETRKGQGSLFGVPFGGHGTG